MGIVLNFGSLTSRFNDGLAHPKRRVLYEALKSAKLLGKVLTHNEQNLIRPYLFDTQNSKYWFELPLFETNRLEELEEARVERYLDWQLERMSPNHSSYPKTRDQKARQLLSLLREFDDRVDLVEQAERAGASGDLSLGQLPCSWDYLTRICQAFPSAVTVIDLAGTTEADFKAKGIRNPAAKQLAAFVAEKLQKHRENELRPAVAKRLKTAEAAGQARFF